MPTLLASVAFRYPNEDYFTIALRHGKLRTHIAMQLSTSIINTVDLPGTYRALKKFLPSILKSKCFNDDNVPFAEEVKHTEIGHLFEHILLEYLCQHKLAKGVNDVVFSGTTKWNWYLDPRGTFHITVSAGLRNLDIFPIALEKSVQLLQIIIEEGYIPHSKDEKPRPVYIFSRAPRVYPWVN